MPQDNLILVFDLERLVAGESDAARQDVLAETQTSLLERFGIVGASHCRADPAANTIALSWLFWDTMPSREQHYAQCRTARAERAVLDAVPKTPQYQNIDIPLRSDNFGAAQFALSGAIGTDSGVGGHGSPLQNCTRKDNSFVYATPDGKHVFIEDHCVDRYRFMRLRIDDDARAMLDMFDAALNFKYARQKQYAARKQ